MQEFPQQQPGKFFVTEGGIETEIMYKWGFEIPHFAMFPLLEKKDSATAIQEMYKRYLDVVAKYGHSALIGGFDYRASPDWGLKLGYSRQALEEANLGAIEFLRNVASEYSEIPDKRFVGYVGPRGDAYLNNRKMTVEEAEDYHSIQLTTLRKASVDLVWAMTFSEINEVIGVCHAAKKLGLPVAVSFTLNTNHKLNSGLELSEAIKIVDAATDQYPAFFSLNCSHPIEFTPALGQGGWMNRIRSIRPNAAKMDKIALCQLGHLEEGDPIELGQLMSDVSVKYPHIDIWGGCCGTCHTHLEEMIKHLS